MACYCGHHLVECEKTVTTLSTVELGHWNYQIETESVWFWFEPASKWNSRSSLRSHLRGSKPSQSTWHYQLRIRTRTKPHSSIIFSLFQRGFNANKFIRNCRSVILPRQMVFEQTSGLLLRYCHGLSSHRRPGLSLLCRSHIKTTYECLRAANVRVI